MADWVPTLRRVFAVLATAAGLSLFGAASLVAYRSILPQWRAFGWSLSDSSMILNQVWRGNQLYLLVLLYAGLGLALTI